MCGNCGTGQGPFERSVLPLTLNTDHTPAKNQVSFAVCGFRRKTKPTKEERLARVRECNQRREELLGGSK